jgi:nucleotide-binding universal stress UspA family protein
MLPFQKILCPTDFSAPAEAALVAALEVAHHFHSTLHLVHVVAALPTTRSDPNYSFHVPEYEAALHAEAREKLESIAAGIRAQGLSVEYAIGHGHAGREIVRMATELGVDLIVIATHGETGWRHVIFGSVAERVVRLAECPVLIVRTPHE